MTRNDFADAIAKGINKLGWSPDVPNSKGKMEFDGECHEVQTIVDEIMPLLKSLGAKQGEMMLKATSAAHFKAFWQGVQKGSKVKLDKFTVFTFVVLYVSTIANLVMLFEIWMRLKNL